MSKRRSTLSHQPAPSTALPMSFGQKRFRPAEAPSCSALSRPPEWPAQNDRAEVVRSRIRRRDVSM